MIPRLQFGASPASPAGAFLAAALLLASPAFAAEGKEGGQAEIALQGYYLGGSSQNLLGTTGVAVKFEEFLPKLGLLRGSLEGYRTGGGIRSADNFLELRGLVRAGFRWNLTAGDFRAKSTLVHNPFFNLFFPEINARGMQVEASNSRTSYTFFFGKETLMGGPRIPFRVSVPQTVMGVDLRHSFGQLETGVRLLRLSSREADFAANSFLFPAGRQFLSSNSLTVYSAYKFSENLRWYGEASAATSKSVEPQPAASPVSFFFGPSWESPRLTFRANYAHLSRSYFPLAGFWVGDRKGPFAEFRVRPLPQLELFASASRYETTTKNDPASPFIRSTGTSAGASVQLPWRFNASGQLSTIQFYSANSSTGATQNSRNRQLTGTLSRQFQHHNIRFTLRDMRLMVLGSPQHERSAELEDTIRIRRVVLGAAVRSQQSSATEHRNSLYFRGSAQINLGRLSAFGYFEGGKDLINQTVFATNTTNSTVIAATVRVTSLWSVQAEANRSRLVANLNPESLFIQSNQGVIVNPVLNRFEQWSFLFRIIRSLHWGTPPPPGGMEQHLREQIPITGSIEGFVHVPATGKRRPAPSVVIALESGLSATTDASGRYRFDSVPEGLHTVRIDLDALPASYNPGKKTEATVTVRPKRASRADFDLQSLSGFSGNIVMPAGKPREGLEGIVVRVNPGGRYTTSFPDGTFAFYNLPEGDYEVSIAPDSIPAALRLKSAVSAGLSIRAGETPPSVTFELEKKPVAGKAVRRVLEERITSSFMPLLETVDEPVTEPPPPPVPTRAIDPAMPAVPQIVPPLVLTAADHNARGRELLYQGKQREAIAEFTAALRKRPAFPQALNARGLAHMVIGELDRALADFEAALRLDPNYANAQHNRTVARQQLQSRPAPR